MSEGVKRFLAVFLARFEWYRRWHGGKWMRVYVREPVNAMLWLPCPFDATPDYREGLWAGGGEFRDYDKPRMNGAAK